MSRLGALKKGELVSIANELGLDSDGIKIDIESRISQHLAQNEATLSNDPRYAPFYGSSPSKARRRSKKAESDEPSCANSPIKSTRDDDEDGDEDGEYNDTVLDRSREIVSTFSEQATDYYYTVQEYVEEYADIARQSLSNIHFINSLATAIELGIVLVNLFKWTNMDIGAGFYIPLPQPEILLNYEAFWRPLIVWTLFSFIIPGVTSYFINFTGAASGSRRRAKNQSDFDPFIYNLTRLVTSYVVYQGSRNGRLNYFTDFGLFYTSALKASIPILDSILGEFPKISGSVVLALTVYAAIA